MSNIFNYFDNVILAETLNDKTKSKFEIIENKEDLTNLINTDYSEAFRNYKNGNIIYRGARNYFKNANDDYDYFLTLANIEKNMYNKDSIKIDKQNKKITIKSLTSAEKEYAIIKYIVTWQYEEYKYKLS